MRREGCSDLPTHKLTWSVRVNSSSGLSGESQRCGLTPNAYHFSLSIQRKRHMHDIFLLCLWEDKHWVHYTTRQRLTRGGRYGRRKKRDIHTACESEEDEYFGQKSWAEGAMYDHVSLSFRDLSCTTTDHWQLCNTAQRICGAFMLSRYTQGGLLQEFLNISVRSEMIIAIYRTLSGRLCSSFRTSAHSPRWRLFRNNALAFIQGR